MGAIMQAVRLGLRRGWIEFTITIRDPQTVIWYGIIFGIFLTVLWFQRDNQVSGLSLALFTLPSLIGMQIASSGFTDIASILSYEREDGTLLRAKAIPQGMLGYLVSKITVTVLTSLVSVLFLLVPSLLIVGEAFANIAPQDILFFVAFLLLGLAATAPFGAIIGSLVKSAGSGWGLTMLPLVLLVAISGIFYPITALAGWIQIVAQVFPVYWLAHGVRWLFMPEGAKAVELYGQWRPGMAFVVLVAWAVVGMLIAPRILRRMARRVSGSEVEAGRQRTIQRGY